MQTPPVELKKDDVEIVITTTGAILVYLAHNHVRIGRSDHNPFRTLPAFIDWLKRRNCNVVKTTWPV